jgi:predicted ATPase
MSRSPSCTTRYGLPPPREPGSAILLGGEAGIGKTLLVRHIARQTGQVWLGACDPLETPRALASARLEMVPDILDGSPSCQLIRVARNTQLPGRVRRALGRPR